MNQFFIHIRKNSIDIKKTNLVDLLNIETNLLNLKEKHPNNISTHSNKSIDDKTKYPNKMKDKIRNFVFEIEGISAAKSNSHPAKEMPRQIHNENLKYEYNSTTNACSKRDDYNSFNGNREYKFKNNYSATNLNLYNGNNILKSPKSKDEKNTNIITNMNNKFDTNQDKGTINYLNYLNLNFLL